MQQIQTVAGLTDPDPAIQFIQPFGIPPSHEPQPRQAGWGSREMPPGYRGPDLDALWGSSPSRSNKPPVAAFLPVGG